MNKFYEDLKSGLNITLSDIQKEQFSKYYQILIEYNQKINLTRITAKEEVYYKHFYDSLSIVSGVDFQVVKNVCDLGSGAGFPGIPLAIVFPKIKFTLVDSLGKRIIFLELLTRDLNLKNVNIENRRAEDYSREHLNMYDLVTARAFSKLGIFIEIAVPLAKKEGLICAMKGPEYNDELKRSEYIMDLLHTTIQRVFKFELPYSYGERTIIILKKNKHINGYPRKFSIIKKENQDEL